MDPLDDPRLTTAGLFIESYAGLRDALERDLRRDAGLPPQWFEVLLRLARTPGGALRMSELAAQTTFTPSGLTRAVDRLEADGLVARQACPTDRRGSLAVLTAAGRERIESATPRHLEHLEQHLLAPFSPRERAQLDRLLRKLRDHVRPGATSGAAGTEGAGV